MLLDIPLCYFIHFTLPVSIPKLLLFCIPYVQHSLHVYVYLHNEAIPYTLHAAPLLRFDR